MDRLLLVLIVTLGLISQPALAQSLQDTTISGKVWRASDSKFIPVSAMLEDIIEKEFILIGERHGRSAHQNREAFIIGALAERQKYPTVAMEMIAEDQTEIISQFRRRSPEHATMLALDLDWASSNWPAWSYYLPIFEAAFLAKLDILGADVPTTHSIEDADASAAPEAVRRSWKESLRRAHCNRIEEDRLAKLSALQIERDQKMSATMLEAAEAGDGVILIAGSSHVRKDRGVPIHLPEESFVSIALIETLPDKIEPSEYLPHPIKDAGGPVFDYIWFTPRVPKEDICARFN